MNFFLDILAINARKWYEKRAFLINSHGDYDQLDFGFGDKTEVSRSCSVQHQNYLYVFGGENEKRQVSVVNGYRLERKATLDFDFSEGACTVLNQITIVLCFPNGEYKVCRQSNNPYGSFTELPNSNHDHRSTRIGSFDG